MQFEVDEFPLTDEGTALIDVFIHLPRNRRFIKFIMAGDPLVDKHKRMLDQHDPATLFGFYKDHQSACPDHPIPETEHNQTVLLQFENPEKFQEVIAQKNEEETETETDGTEDQNETVVIQGDEQDDSHKGNEKRVFKGEKSSDQNPNETLVIEGSGSRQNKKEEELAGSRHTEVYQENDYSGSRVRIDPAKIEETTLTMEEHLGTDNAQFLKKAISKELQEVFDEVTASSTASMNLEDSPVHELSEKLLNVIAPEVENFRAHLKKIPNYVGVMDDAAAITSIATLFCIARGQSSRSIFREVAYACLFLDMSLAQLTHEERQIYYVNPNQLDDKQKKLIFMHPRRSYEIVQQKFKNLPDIVGQMILGHHELFNGKGYPRKVRSELLAPLVRIVAFAVDVFEDMKRAFYQGKTVSLIEAVEAILNAGSAPHERRHNIVLVREVHAFLLEEDDKLNQS